MNYLSNKYRNCGMVNGDRTSGVLGGTGDPSQPGSQLRVPVHHLALPHHHHNLTAAVVPHIGDERLVRQRSGSRRMNGRGDRRLRRSDPRHQRGSERGPDRNRPQRAMLQESTARLISHGILQCQEQTGSSGNVRKRSHSATRRRLTITHTQVRVRLAQPAKEYVTTNTNRTTSTQIVTERNPPARPRRDDARNLTSRSVSMSSQPGRNELRASADRRQTGPGPDQSGSWRRVPARGGDAGTPARAGPKAASCGPLVPNIALSVRG